MMTNAATHRNAPSARPPPPTTAQKVVIVNGTPEILDLLETVLDAGHYDVVFVESSEHAYSQIKRVQPNLVILCVRIDDSRRLPGAVDAEARRRDPRRFRCSPTRPNTTARKSDEEVPEMSGDRDVRGEARRSWMN